MKLIRTPSKPRHHPLLVDKLNNPRYAPWRAFLPNAMMPNEN